MAGALFLCAVTSRTSSNPFQGEKRKYAGQSVRALPIRILSVGKKRSPGVQLMVDEYVQKLKYYCSVDDVQIRSNPRNARDMRAQVDDEDKAVMNIVRSDDWVVMLDERGQDIDSEQMAGFVADAGHRVKLTSHHDIFVTDLYHTCKFLVHEKFSNEHVHCHFAERALRVYHAADPGPPLILLDKILKYLKPMMHGHDNFEQKNVLDTRIKRTCEFQFHTRIKVVNEQRGLNRNVLVISSQHQCEFYQ